jgi:hypothetical protein
MSFEEFSRQNLKFLVSLAGGAANPDRLQDIYLALMELDRPRLLEAWKALAQKEAAGLRRTTDDVHGRQAGSRVQAVGPANAPESRAIEAEMTERAGSTDQEQQVISRQESSRVIEYLAQVEDPIERWAIELYYHHFIRETLIEYRVAYANQMEEAEEKLRWQQGRAASTPEREAAIRRGIKSARSEVMKYAAGIQRIEETLQGLRSRCPSEGEAALQPRRVRSGKGRAGRYKYEVEGFEGKGIANFLGVDPSTLSLWLSRLHRSGRSGRR